MTQTNNAQQIHVRICTIQIDCKYTKQITQKMIWQDKIAIFLFASVFLASCLTEFYCGNGSQNCRFDWSGFYGSAASYVPGRCMTTTSNSGLGDTMLSVSSLFLVVPIVYFSKEGPWFTPVMVAFLGIASFLYHAANTHVSSSLDWVGIVTLGPSLTADFLVYMKYLKTGVVYFVVFVIFNFVFRFEMNTWPTLSEPQRIYLYIINSFSTVLILSLAYKWEKLKFLALGTIFLIGGSIALIVGNNVDHMWDCVNTQLIEPHFWGHLLIAVGATFFVRSIYTENHQNTFEKGEKL